MLSFLILPGYLQLFPGIPDTLFVISHRGNNKTHDYRTGNPGDNDHHDYRKGVDEPAARNGNHRPHQNDGVNFCGGSHPFSGVEIMDIPPYNRVGKQLPVKPV